jgi:Protein of unknown function (DUF3500)
MSTLFLIAALLGPIANAEPDDTATIMAEATHRFVASLDDGQRAKATFTFESPERFNWHWIPRERKGLPFKELKPEQRALGFAMLDAGLSDPGMLKATTIMSLEEILRVDENGTGPIRDPELYYISVFGTPGDKGVWGYRIEGHHLALNYTIKDGQVVSATPFMMGSNPALVRQGPRKGLRNLVEIESPANELALSLTPDQRAKAVVNDVAPEVTTTPNSAQPEPTNPEGIPVGQLDARQRELLLRLVRTYSTSFPDPIHSSLLHDLDKGADGLHFAWYGPVDVSKPHAFRIKGTTLLIDFNDTQNDTNHIHTYYRSMTGDFGAK